MGISSIIHASHRLAIVGMEAAWAGCEDLDAFVKMTYEGRVARPAPHPAAAGEEMLTRVALRALANAGLDLDRPGLRIAALAAAAQPVRPGWGWADRFEDLSGCANPLVDALRLAATWLFAGETGPAADLVLFVAGAGLPERPPEELLANDAGAGFGFDRGCHGWRLGEGAGAVALMSYERALQEARPVVAVIRAAAAAGEAAPGNAANAGNGWLPTAPPLEHVRGCCQAAFAEAGLSAEQVGYVEAFASGQDALDGIEIAGTVQAYRLPAQDLATALGGVQGNTGFLGAAAGLASLVRAALCVSQRILPAAPGWSTPKLPALWRGAPFYVPQESRTWFWHTNGSEATGFGRTAGVNVVGRNGSFAHLLISAPASQPAPTNQALVHCGFYLFPLSAADLDDLLRQLEQLKGDLAHPYDLQELAARYYTGLQGNEAKPYALALVGHDAEEIGREIEYALKAVPAAFEKGADWQTPLGSFFTPQPAGRLGGVALVYPGAFNSYPGVGKDLFYLFPELHRSTAGITADLGRVIHERLLYPRSLSALSKDEMAALEAKLLADPIAMLISGTTLAILYTHILTQIFKVRPAAAFGYSLGENSMMYATGVWGQGDSAAARLAESVCFRSRLAGPQQAIREYWGLTGAAPTEGQPLWSNYLVMATPEKVRAALEKEPRVYLTHVNTPRQVVIGGDPEGCKRVLAELRCSALQAPFDYALHCEVMRSEEDELAKLHNWPIETEPALRMYSAVDDRPLTLARNRSAQEEASRKLASMLVNPLDFPRLVRQVYADGARVFIEAGAGSNCSRWVDESLKDRPHLSLSMNRRGTDDTSTLIRTLARLYSHRVPMDLSALYARAREANP